MKLFKSITREHAAYERRREQVIKSARGILRDSKRVIFFCHEGKTQDSKRLLASTSRLIAQLESKYQKPLYAKAKSFSLDHEGAWASAVEEFLEAWFFYHFLSTQRVVEPKHLQPSVNVYIGALADFTGELLRTAVVEGASRNIRALERYRAAISDVVAFMLPLYLTGQNRQKFDQAKRNLRRIEEIIYEVKIRSSQ